MADYLSSNSLFGYLSEPEIEFFIFYFWIYNVITVVSSLITNFESLIQVRAYAVSVLERADDEELQCYLLQLVQALRFERSDKSCLSHFLVQRCKLDVTKNIIFLIGVRISNSF